MWDSKDRFVKQRRGINFCFALRLIALVPCCAGTLGSSYVEETPTYLRGWYWLAIEQILSSGMVLVDDVDLFLAAPGFDQSTIVFLHFCLKQVRPSKTRQRAIWKPGTNSGFLPSRKGKNPEWRRKKKKKPPLRRMGRAECPNGCKEHPAAPDHKSYVPPSSNSPHSKPQGINYLQSLYWFDQRNSVDWCQEVISGFLLLIEGCPGLWKIETYSIKDASFNQVCEILKICLSSKGGESIPVFLLRLIALVRWYAGTLGSSYVAETPTYSRGWYWLAIEQILSSGMVLVDDVDLFLEAPGFDQSTIVFQFFFVTSLA